MTDESTPDQHTLSPDGRYRWDGHTWVPVDAAPPETAPQAEETPQASANPYGSPAPYEPGQPYGQTPYGQTPSSQAPSSQGNPYAANPYAQNPYAPSQTPVPFPPYPGQPAVKPTDAPGLGRGWLVAISPIFALGFLALLGWYVGQYPGDAELPDREAGILGLVMIGGWFVGGVLALVGALLDRERLSRAGIQVPLVWSVLALVVWPVGSLCHLITRTARSGRGVGGIVTWVALTAGLVVSCIVMTLVAGAGSSGIDSSNLEEYLERDIPKNVSESIEVDEDEVSADCPGDRFYDLDEVVECQISLGNGFEGRAEVEFPTSGVYKWVLYDNEGDTTDS